MVRSVRRCRDRGLTASAGALPEVLHVSPQPDQVVDVLLAEHRDPGHHMRLDNGIGDASDGRAEVEVDGFVLFCCGRRVDRSLRGFAGRHADLILVTHVPNLRTVDLLSPAIEAAHGTLAALTVCR